MITLINMCSFYENSEQKDYAGLLFLAFVITNNIILFNIFIGLVVGIGMEYAKEIFENDKERAENLEVEMARANNKYTKRDMQVENSHILMGDDGDRWD